MLRFLLFIALFCLNSCSQEEVTIYCDTENPLESLEWLKDIVEPPTQLRGMWHLFQWVRRIEYQGQEVFVLGSCCPSCFWVPVYYSCEGEVITYSQEDARRVLPLWRESGEFVWEGGECAGK